MIRLARLLLPCLGLALAPPVAADLTLKGRSGLLSMNMPNIGQETLYVGKQHMRRDFTLRGRSYSYLYDLGKREVTELDHFLRQAEVHPLKDARKSREGKLDDKAVKLTLTPAGEKQKLQHWECERHQLEASVPAQLGQEKVTLVLDGTLWLARKAPEKALLAPFIRAVEADDFFMGAPNQGAPAAAGPAAQSEGVNEVLRRVLPQGMLCAGEIVLQYEGGGPMANLARRMATRLSIVWEKIDDAPLADDLFVIPSGYRVTRD